MTYHVVAADDTLLSIATRYGVDWQEIVRLNRLAETPVPWGIKAGDRLQVKPVAVSPYPSGLPKANLNDPSARALQDELKRVGYMSFEVVNSDTYGPATRAAVAEFHDQFPHFKAKAGFRPQIGWDGWAHLLSMGSGTGRAPSAANVAAARPEWREPGTTTPPPAVTLTADALRQAATGGTAISTAYRDGSMSVSSTVHRKGSFVYFHAGMSICCDGRPGSACNAGSDPWFQAQTAFAITWGPPAVYPSAEVLPYVVLPLSSSRWNYRTAGISGGDLCAVAYKDKLVYAVVGDLGPASRIGEGSHRLASMLGINPNPRTGGVGSGVTYVVFPGVKASPWHDPAAIARLGPIETRKIL